MTKRQRKRYKTLFLERFALNGNIAATCRELGIDRWNVYHWQEADDEFAHGFRQAELESTERLEAEAFRRAHDGVEQTRPVMSRGEVVGEITTTIYSDALLIFLLKARKPEVYRERWVTAAGGAADVKLVDREAYEAL